MAPNNSDGAETVLDRRNLLQQRNKVIPKEQSVTPSASKQLHQTQLGRYSATAAPMLVLFINLIGLVYITRDVPPDPRLPDRFLADSFWTISILTVGYILFSVVWGPKMMEGRKPYQLKKFMLFYNAVQVICSSYMFYEAGMAGWFFDYSYRCQPYDTADEGKPLRMAKIVHLCFLSKILDCVDTVVFILRGKHDQVTNLHLVHHSSMIICMWFGANYQGVGHATFPVFINAFVHIWMYSYYLLAGLGPRIQPYLWWKKYITRMQLVQFVTILVHGLQLAIFPCKGVFMGILMCIEMNSLIFFCMFMNFYLKAYIYGERSKIKKTPVEDKPHEEQTSKSAQAISSSSEHTITSNGSAGTDTNGIAGFMNGSVTHRVLKESSFMQ